MKFVTIEQVLQMHVLVVNETGGSTGLRDLGRLEAALATQQQNVFNKEAYTGLIEKAAALIRGIIADHPFVDGNKRTAYAALDTFLRLNELAYAGRPLDLALQLEAVASREDTLDAATDRFEAWLRERVGSRAS